MLFNRGLGHRVGVRHAMFGAHRTNSAPPASMGREAFVRTRLVGVEESLSPEATGLPEGVQLSVDGLAENAAVASGKLISILLRREAGVCDVETASVYGAALAMPQIARSSGWTRRLTHLALRSYVFLVVNVIVQASLLYLISFEEMVMDKFSGQMYLCDFGAYNPSRCPDGPGCRGPMGTEYTPSRLYGWEQWVTRNFVKDSLKAVFPERLDDVERVVDPGEYGLESYHCRLLCCFLFMMAVMNDFSGTIGMLSLLWHVPNAAEPWLAYEVPQWATKEYIKAVHGYSELDLVNVQVAGMPVIWKLINFIFIFVPKLVLWKCTAQAGTTFLMETSAIEDLIVNSIALTFILNIDEMICETFTTAGTRYLMDRLEGFKLYDATEEEAFTDQQNIDLVRRERNFWMWSCRDTWALLPMRLLVSVFFTFFFVANYYESNCTTAPDGSLVSHSMYLPVYPYYTQGNFWIRSMFPQASEDQPFWVSPSG